MQVRSEVGDDEEEQFRTSPRGGAGTCKDSHHTNDGNAVVIVSDKDKRDIYSEQDQPPRHGLADWSLLGSWDRF